MNKVKIIKTTKADTRSEDIKNVSELDVLDDTMAHQRAVQLVFRALTDYGNRQVSKHDFTKTENLSMFTRALRTGFKNDEFRKLDWFKDIHVKEERHHLKDNVPEDVNLIDIMEMLVDVVCAGLARTGEVYPVAIPCIVLKKAMDNTVQLLKDNIEVVDTKPENASGRIEGPYDKKFG